MYYDKLFKLLFWILTISLLQSKVFIICFTLYFNTFAYFCINAKNVISK